jgi:hypothetical protein
LSVEDNAIINLVPVPAANIELEIVEDEVLLYDPEHATVVYLSPTAAVVWGLCDAKRSVGAIIDLIREGYPDGGPDLLRDVLVTVTKLQESGVLVVR